MEISSLRLETFRDILEPILRLATLDVTDLLVLSHTKGFFPATATYKHEEPKEVMRK